MSDRTPASREPEWGPAQQLIADRRTCFLSPAVVKVFPVVYHDYGQSRPLSVPLSPLQDFLPPGWRKASLAQDIRFYSRLVLALLKTPFMNAVPASETQFLFPYKV